MFQASRNWSGISSLVSGMRHHVTQLPHSGNSKEGRRGIQLINDHGEMIEGYDAIFRELFCLAAAALADRLREHLTSVGVLWDEILPTGAISKRALVPQPRLRQGSIAMDIRDSSDVDPSRVDLAEKGLRHGQGEYARGSLMFLVRRVRTDREAERLISAGYRFAEPHQISELIKSSMQIQSPEFESKLQDMATYADQQTRIQPGVHLGFFAVRARVGLGFEVLVRKGARNLLPSKALAINGIEQWHIAFLKQLNGQTVPDVLQSLNNDTLSPRPSREVEFARHLREAIKGLREWIQEPLFEGAVLSSTIVRLPLQEEGRQKETVMMALRLVIPIHSVLSSPNCELVPLSFFRMRQVMDQCNQEFIRGVHREFAPIVQPSGNRRDRPDDKPPRLWRFGRADGSNDSKSGGKMTITMPGRRTSSLDSTRTSSTINLCPPGGNHRPQSVDMVDESTPYRSREGSLQPPPSYGGIMVFQEITINVEEGQPESRKHPERSKSQDTIVADLPNVLRKSSTASGIELRPMVHAGSNTQNVSQVTNDVVATSGDVSNIPSFVDVLFAECVESR